MNLQKIVENRDSSLTKEFLESFETGLPKTGEEFTKMMEDKEEERKALEAKGVCATKIEVKRLRGWISPPTCSICNKNAWYFLIPMRVAHAKVSSSGDNGSFADGKRYEVFCSCFDHLQEASDLCIESEKEINKLQ